MKSLPDDGRSDCIKVPDKERVALGSILRLAKNPTRRNRHPFEIRLPRMHRSKKDDGYSRDFDGDGKSKASG